MTAAAIARRLALLLWVGIVAEAALIVLVVISLGNGTDGNVGAMVKALLWSMLPLAAMAGVDWAWRRSGLPRLVSQTAALLALLAGAWFYVDATWIHPSSLSGLVFLAAPLWQWGLLAAGSLVAALMQRWMKRRTAHTD